MITLLIGINGFVFMSMRDVALEDNLLYTAAMVSSSIILISLIGFLMKQRKKKTIQDSL